MPRDGAVLIRADRTIRDLRSLARRGAHVLKELQRLQDGDLLGRYPLGPDEEIGGEVLDFLRLAAADRKGQEVDVVVIARERRDQGGANGRGRLQQEGA